MAEDLGGDVRRKPGAEGIGREEPREFMGVNVSGLFAASVRPDTASRLLGSGG